MIGRLINSLWKGVKSTVIGSLGTILALIAPWMPKPIQEIDTPEKVGLSVLIGAVVGLVDALKRFLLYKTASDHPR